MGKQETPGVSRRQREFQEQERLARRSLHKANIIVSVLFILVWLFVLLKYRY